MINLTFKPLSPVRDKFLLAIAFLIFIYICLRSLMVGIKFDEAWTIRDYASNSYNAIFSCTPCDANNHLLNSALTRFSFRIGFTEFWARVPNLMAGFIFLLFSYKLATEKFKGILKYAFFLLLTLNPFLLEFFALSRGYGLALCFTLTSVYFLLKFKEVQRDYYLLLVLIISALAVLSNFTFLNYFLSILCILILIVWDTKFSLLKFLIYSVPIIWLVRHIILVPIQKLMEGGNFSYGGIHGVHWDSFYSLTRSSLYAPFEYEMSYRILWIATIISGIILILRLVSVRSLSGFIRSKEMMLTLLFLLPLIANHLQNYLFEIKFLAERTALFYYVLLVLCLAFLVKSVKISKLNHLGIALIFTASLAITYNFVKSINFYKTVTWFFDAHTEEVLAIIHNTADPKKQILASEWPFKMSAQYYQKYKNYTKVNYDFNQAYSNDITADYYLHLSEDLHEYGFFSKDQPVLKMDYDTIRSWPEEGVHLFRINR